MKHRPPRAGRCAPRQSPRRLLVGVPLLFVSAVVVGNLPPTRLAVAEVEPTWPPALLNAEASRAHALMAKLVLQLQAAAERRGHGLGPGRRHHASAAAAQGRGFVLCLLVPAAAANTLALHRPNRAAAYDDASLPREDQPHPTRAALPVPRARRLLTLFQCTASSGFAIVINTWKRHALLWRSAAHYAACAGVDAVHIVWSEPGEPPESLRRSIINSTRRGIVRTLQCLFLVANVTGAPPIWVQGRIYKIGSSGIGSLKGHFLCRDPDVSTHLLPRMVICLLWPPQSWLLTAAGSGSVLVRSLSTPTDTG